MTQAISKLRQTKHGHRTDARIGEASRPGQKRKSNTDEPDVDVDASWVCSKCTTWNNEFLKYCEICGGVKRPRRTETGVSAAAQIRTPPKAPARVVTLVASLAKVHLSPILPDTKPLVDGSPTGVSATPAGVMDIYLPAKVKRNLELIFSSFANNSENNYSPQRC